MLTNMKAKLDASRALLYETSRFVDVYKAYMHIADERKLTKEEQDDMKFYSKLADAYTPLAKGLSSEYCNQLAYDAVQIHGGSGFMKDYPVERIYRDARITSIYEGTTQLQVVAAIRAVTTHTYLKHIRDCYEKEQVKPELESLKRSLVEMTDDYEKVVNKVIEIKDNDFIDFHARRMVEMAGNIIMGHLLVIDANKEDMFTRSAEVFIKMGKSENKAKADFISNSTVDDLGKYKMELN